MILCFYRFLYSASCFAHDNPSKTVASRCRDVDDFPLRGNAVVPRDAWVCPLEDPDATAGVPPRQERQEIHHEPVFAHYSWCSVSEFALF